MREKKATSSETVYFVRDGQNVLIETDANLITQAHYTDFPRMWGGLASERRGPIGSFYGFDQQSDTCILVSIGGNITDSYTFKSFGEVIAVLGTTVNYLRFGGQVGYYRDLATRLDVGRRVLRTDQGRWMSRDPIGYAGGVNLYGYVGNGPVVGVDPSGTQYPIQQPFPITVERKRYCCSHHLPCCKILMPFFPYQPPAPPSQTDICAMPQPISGGSGLLKIEKYCVRQGSIDFIKGGNYFSASYKCRNCCDMGILTQEAKSSCKFACDQLFMLVA